MASKLSTLEEKMQHLEDDYQTKKGNLEWSISKLKSELLEVAKDMEPIPGTVRSSESNGSYFVKIGGFFYGINTHNGEAVGIEEISKDFVLSRNPDYK